jgi:tetratricopeptide (TPR) repeat protein
MEREHNSTTSPSMLQKISRQFSKLKLSSKSSTSSYGPPIENIPTEALSNEPLPDYFQSQLATLKKSGNENFNKGDYKSALLDYDKGISLCKEKAYEHNVAILREWLPAFYSNRAACFLPLRRFKEALHDSELAIIYKPQYFKVCRSLCSFVAPSMLMYLIGTLSKGRRFTWFAEN